MYPEFTSEYHMKIRPYIFIFTIIYNAIFIFISLWEPIFYGYSEEQIANSYNCSSGYRYRLYQYLLTSATYNIPFSIAALICTGIVIHKFRITPLAKLKNMLSFGTQISFKRWLRILAMNITICLISFLNLYNDIKNGIASENNTKKEEESLGIIYFLTAFSGVLLFILTNSKGQIKKKFGIQTSVNKEYVSTNTPSIQRSRSMHSRVGSAYSFSFNKNSSYYSGLAQMSKSKLSNSLINIDLERNNNNNNNNNNNSTSYPKSSKLNMSSPDVIASLYKKNNYRINKSDDDIINNSNIVISFDKYNETK
ncbi:hypothetical protein BCR32DRAFT_271815 [Anaeromyces robustus]|uniref:Uncharacterized protein n=1 Tax=Anaeromyces robustus TaxID=1754192 RepID=A0A1Y1WQE2_9FUNG|nr:hypothetical protein BCR32DRAFT_271815 [Anaeromyces robustus]|eukprot:ORX75615.1 hypothetical protein BCR32DRAFT_271815 [Anaeromyces robustus]